MHFIEQIFLFMNSVFNISIILGNKPGPILIFQHSHNFTSIMNLFLISGFPKDPIFHGNEAAFQNHTDFSLEELQMLRQLWMWLNYSISPFLFSVICVCVYEHSPMRCNESNTLLQEKRALPGAVWIPSLAEKLWSSVFLHGIKSRWRARLGFITCEILSNTQGVWMDLQNMVLGETQTVLQWCLKVTWDLLGNFWWRQSQP